MKFLLVIILGMSFNAFGKSEKSTKVKKEPNMVALSAGLDFDPKKIFLRVKFKPNSSGEQKLFENITVKNTTKESTLARLIFYEYNPDEFGKNDVKKSKANIKVPEFSLNEYISFPRDVISLEPGESKTIPVEILVNKSFVGTKYALFTFEKVNNLVVNNTFSRKSAIALELEVLGAIIIDLAGTGTTKVEQQFVEFKNNRLIIDVANTGDHMLDQPVLEAVLLDSNMNVVEKFSMQPSRLNPTFTHRTKRRFFYNLMKKYPKGKYKIYTQFRAEGGTFSDGQKFEVEF